MSSNAASLLHRKTQQRTDEMAILGAEIRQGQRPQNEGETEK